jgi:hypothetical protein
MTPAEDGGAAKQQQLYQLQCSIAVETIDALLADARLILFRGYRLELIGVALRYWKDVQDGATAKN